MYSTPFLLSGLGFDRMMYHRTKRRTNLHIQKMTEKYSESDSFIKWNERLSLPFIMDIDAQISHIVILAKV